MSGSNGKIAICPGSYDPITYGHLDTIKRAARIFERVIVGVVNQPVRKQQTMFSADERKQFIESAIEDVENIHIEVFDTLLVEFARKHEASVLVKGLRAISDFEYEFEMNQLNRKLDPGIESMYLMASPEFSFLSSSGVKEMAAFGGDFTDLVPRRVAEGLKERYGR